MAGQCTDVSSAQVAHEPQQDFQIHNPSLPQLTPSPSLPNSLRFPLRMANPQLLIINSAAHRNMHFRRSR